MRRALIAGALFVACHPKPDASLAPLNVVVVAPSPEYTVMMGSFTAARDLRYRDAHCIAVPLRDGAEPVSADAGRLEVWEVGGEVLGHVERGPAGTYQAAVRRVVATGTRLAANIPGAGDVAAHRFRTPARVPASVTREAPAQGFEVRVGAGLPVRWRGGDGSHVTITLALEPVGPGEGILVTCTAPRSSGSFTIPAAAIARERVPAVATVARLTVASTDRARDGDYALDVVPLAGDGAMVQGSVAR